MSASGMVLGMAMLIFQHLLEGYQTMNLNDFGKPLTFCSSYHHEVDFFVFN